MPVFVVLALAVLAMSVGAAVVAALQVWGAVKRVRATVDSTVERIRTLTAELQAELAVASTEFEAVSARVAALGEARSGRRRHRGKRRTS